LLIPLVTITALAMTGGSQSAIEIVAKVAVTSIAFWATGDIAIMPIQFFQLDRDSDRVVDKCEAASLGVGHNSDTEALIAFAEYTSAVAKAPPIPDRVYRKHNKNLNEAWQQRHLGHPPAGGVVATPAA